MILFYPGYDTITLHHTGSDKPIDSTPQKIKALHTNKNIVMFNNKAMKARDWLDIGYHFFVSKMNIYQMRPLAIEGAHIKGHNEGKIAICLAGESYSVLSRSFYATKHLVTRICKEYIKNGESLDNITCHRHYAETLCPNFSPLTDILYGQTLDPRKSPTYYRRDEWDK